MADYLQSLEDIYSKLYKTKEQEALRKKNQSLTDLDSQQEVLINKYQELQNALNARKQQTQAQYQSLYTNLDNQLNQGKEQYYNERNNAALNNAQKVQQIKDYMTRNNLMSSGENVDAVLRTNTDYNNNLGSIYNNEQQFTRGINDKRNDYSLAEQNAYTDIDNQLSAADREKAQKIAEILNQRKLIDTNYLSELQSYKDQLDSEKTKAIAEYNERLRQEQLAREAEEREYQRQLALQRASTAKARSSSSKARSSSTSSASKTQDLNAVWSELYKQIDHRSGENFLKQNRDAIISNLGNSEYQKMLNYVKNYKYSAIENQIYYRNLNNRTPMDYIKDVL